MNPTQQVVSAAEAAVEALANCSSQHGHRCNRCDSEVDEGGKVAATLREAVRGLREAQAEPVARVRFDSGEVHIVPRERNVEASPLRDGQALYATPPTTDAPAQGVALTDEQIGDLLLPGSVRAQGEWACALWLARAIERAVWAANGIAAPTQEGAPK